ncbi:MAG: hypothetical protein ABII01_04535 [Candidatus Woesearchaeota archaeon]
MKKKRSVSRKSGKSSDVDQVSQVELPDRISVHAKFNENLDFLDDDLDKKYESTFRQDNMRVRIINQKLMDKSKELLHLKQNLLDMSNDVKNRQEYISKLTSHLSERDAIISHLSGVIERLKFDLKSSINRINELQQKSESLENGTRSYYRKLNEKDNYIEEMGKRHNEILAHVKNEYEKKIKESEQSHFKREIELGSAISGLKEKLLHQNRIIEKKILSESAIFDKIKKDFEDLITIHHATQNTHENEMPTHLRGERPQLPTLIAVKKNHNSSIDQPFSSQEIASLIELAFERNQGKEKIRDSLINSGYPEEDVDRELSQY